MKLKLNKGSKYYGKVNKKGNAAIIFKGLTFHLSKENFKVLVKMDNGDEDIIEIKNDVEAPIPELVQ